MSNRLTSMLLGFAFLAAATSGATGVAWGAGLDPSVLSKIDAATFEVVAAKPTHDPLTYEKPLPLDLIPYQQRTDKYHSIGTAFALGHNRYVTAGHVLLSGLDSLWGPPELRDRTGHVYAIGKVLEFSLRKDFVVFSLVHPPVRDVALPVDAKPSLNQTVYAVGNALGTGVVAREGLYTSNTPEQQDGQWNWLRFSAAASPGNSGGPLLDASGKIIGVVLMKSPNENLNYALPISEVLDAPADLAVIDRRMPYQFDLFDTTITGTFKARFALPMGLGEFYARFLKLRQAYADSQLQALLAKDPDQVFPRGTGSDEVLHAGAVLGSFPHLLKRDAAGQWQLAGKQVAKSVLPDNGYLAVGLVGHNVLFHLRKPDSVTDQQLYHDPVRLMDALAGLGFLHRRVGPERIKVTSLGKPALEASFSDSWQRRWQVFGWQVPFGNGRILVLALPVPDGYVGIWRTLPAGDEHDYLINLEAMANFLYVAYDGTLAQWKDYLQNTALLPGAFGDIHVSFEYGKRFSYTSQRVAFTVTPALQKINPDSVLTLGFKYFPDHAKVAWDVADIRLKLDADDKDWINIERHIAPSPDLPQAYQDTWQKISQRQHPFDEVEHNDNDVAKITGVAGAPGQQVPVLYTAFVASEGNHTQGDMKTRLDLLMKGLQVHE